MTEKYGATPMMRQYLQFKARYPDKILFFRMGDFYEMFGDDALEAAPILGIALTTRSVDKKKSIPLCGIPHHAVDKYLPRLIESGKKVVICEQIEDPRQAKGIVKRDVVEIVTPGTTIEEASLVPSQNAYLGAIYGNHKKMALARLELSTGEFVVLEGAPEMIKDQLHMFPPRELLYPESDMDDLATSISLPESNIKNLTPLEDIFFDYPLAKENLLRFFSTVTLEGFGLNGMNHAVAAAGAIFRYLQDNKQNQLNHITEIKLGQSERYMILDAATVRNLELFTNLASGEEKHSFFWSINRTGSAAGARRLRRAVAAPLINKEQIDDRLDAVSEFLEHAELSNQLAAHFKSIPDLERLSGRLGMHKANPRTLLAIRDAIRIGTEIKSSLMMVHSRILQTTYDELPDLSSTADEINQALKEDAPLSLTGGGIIKPGYSEDLDRLNNSIRDARGYIAGLADAEKKRTGIPSLKVGFNKIFGYYIEVTRTHTDKVPVNYIRKQTLVNAERYITEEMKQKEGLILEAEEKINHLEEELFGRLVDQVSHELRQLLRMADLLAEVDLVNGLAILARQEKYRRPIINEECQINIVQGQHPVISQLMGVGNFVANDVKLKSEDTSMIVLTGPNMSGKSTWLRQTGLIVILAQIGSYVPAERAEIGIVDRVFTRVGATDSLTRGQSTFLVEMIETANILHNMTERSLLLLDEIGRGTSTFDGLSVAWAVSESIYKNSTGTPRTLFATHYHEMTGLSAIYPRIKNYQVTVKKWGREVIFLHQVVPGGCDDSYGIEVARLAGLPRDTIKRAGEILRLLESGKFAKSELAKGVHVRLNQPSLFDTPSIQKKTKIVEKLQELDVDKLTPLEALQFLADLKKDVGSK